MSDNKLDSVIKQSLSMSKRKPKGETEQCLSEEELANYITSAISEQPIEETLLRHITECDSCFTKTATAVSTLTSFDKGASYRYDSAAVQRAKSIPKIYPKAKRGYMKRNNYLFIAAGFFILSFVFKRYFLQFLVAALIFGLKWVMDTGGSKALVMIYGAWQDKKKQKDEEKAQEEKRPPFLKNRDRYHF